MHPIGTLQGMPPSGLPGHQTFRPGEQNAHFTARADVATKLLIRVLSVGQIEPSTLIRDALLDAQDFRVSFVHGYFAPDEHAPLDPRQQNMLKLAEAAQSTIPFAALDVSLA